MMTTHLVLFSFLNGASEVTVVTVESGAKYLAEIVEAIVIKLRATSAVTAITSSRVHKALPIRPVYPCIVVHAPSATPWDTKDAQGIDAIIHVECWTRDDRDQDTVRNLRKATHQALHEVSLSLASGNHVQTRMSGGQVGPDPNDAVTIHSMQQFEVFAHA